MPLRLNDKVSRIEKLIRFPEHCKYCRDAGKSTMGKNHHYAQEPAL
jgi:hypothetical protein